MRRCTILVTALLLSLVACTGDDSPSGPGPAEEEAAPEDEEERPAQGLRVGLVLPSSGTGVADEVTPGFLEAADPSGSLDAEVAELRAVVPDERTFVGDVATLLAVEGYDVVCVFGREAQEAITELAARHADTTFCAAPASSSAQLPDNLLLVDVALAELGHVVGVALRELGGEEPVALLGAGNRAGGESFRAGLRAGVAPTPLFEHLGELDELEAELAGALAQDVAAVAVDAGPDARELLEDGIGAPLLAPAPLLADEAGALRWQVRWDVVLDRVLDWHLDGRGEFPEILGLDDDVFEVDHGPQAGPSLVSAVEETMGALARGGLDPLASPEDDAEDDGGDDADEDEEDDATQGDADGADDAA